MFEIVLSLIYDFLNVVPIFVVVMLLLSIFNDSVN